MVNSAGINFGTPNEEFIIESDGNGALTSARNAVTGDEYVGGGGGNFSTAELTVDVSVGFAVYVPYLYEEDGDIYYDTMIVDDGNYSSVLYNNNAIAYVVDRTGDGRTPTITVSGDAQVVDSGIVSITGNCDITLSV